jgi:hypothetical protein
MLSAAFIHCCYRYAECRYSDAECRYAGVVAPAEKLELSCNLIYFQVRCFKFGHTLVRLFNKPAPT